jgi:signal transduction histidine kinase
LSSETQVSLYHICQEALNNVAKHSNSTQVEITLDLAPERFELNIHDNGCGFDLAKPTLPDHYGLQMMFENAKSIGAEMTIKSQPKEGTQINIRWAKTEGK